MNINLVIIKQEEINILKNLLQLYLHDISKYFPIEFDSLKGEYIYDNLDKYFYDSSNYAYFIKDKLEIVGFILINKEDNINILQEIFVLNNYKNKGVGEIAVNQVIKKGKWIIKSLPNSTLAENFWKKTISKITSNYTIEHIGKYNRAIFNFEL